MFKKIAMTTLLISNWIIANEPIPFEFYNQLETIGDGKYQDKNELKIISKDTDGIHSDIAEGSYWNYQYKLQGVRRKPFMKAIAEAIKSRENSTILFRGSDYLFFKLYDKNHNLYKGKIVQYQNKYKVELIREGAIKQKKPNQNIILRNLQFDTNRATLKKGAKGEIARIVKYLNDNPSYKVEIQGHTDSSGNPAHNLKLSKARADTVANEVIKAGIDSSRLTTKGYGDKKPIADNSTKEGRRANRRVELKIISK